MKEYFPQKQNSDIELDQLLHERELRESKLSNRKKLIKFIVFFSILLLYIKVLFFDGFITYFDDSDIFNLPTHRTGRPGYFITALLLGMIFIWMPKNSFSWFDNKIPSEAYKFFGWIIFLVPALILFIINLIK